MNIVLIGFMASGKTTVGTSLAKRMNMQLVDTDDMIEQNTKLEIKDIFNLYGEPYFRSLEHQAIKSLSETTNTVISVGGGCVMYYDNFDMLKQLGVTVFLNAPFQKLIKNLEGKFRPLVGNNINEANLYELWQKRLPTYSQADFVIDTAELDAEQTVEAIISLLQL